MDRTGWADTLLPLLKELSLACDDDEGAPTTVVVLADRSKEEMDLLARRSCVSQVFIIIIIIIIPPPPRFTLSHLVPRALPQVRHYLEVDVSSRSPPAAGAPSRRQRVLCRRGNPVFAADLLRVSVTRARAVLVLADGADAADADASSLRTLMALAVLRRTHGSALSPPSFFVHFPVVLTNSLLILLPSLRRQWLATRWSMRLS